MDYYSFNFFFFNYILINIKYVLYKTIITFIYIYINFFEKKIKSE